MRGAIHQVLDRARLLLLAVALLCCCAPTAQALVSPTPAPSLDWSQPGQQLKEENGLLQKTALFEKVSLTLENQGVWAKSRTRSLNPFGRMVGKWGSMADVNEMQFSSMPRHANSGLSLYPFRGYDPSFLRWLNRDPIGEWGGINLYQFVGNNPISNIDPYGLENPITGPGGVAVGPTSGFANPALFIPQALLRPVYYNPPGPPPHAEMLWNPNTGQWYTAAGINTDDDPFLLVLPLNLSCTAKTAKQGIYEFTAASGKTYVGQSGDIAARLEQHLASGKLMPDNLSTVSTTEVLGGKTAREIAEQLRINELGGIQNLENIRNPIGPARQYLLLSQPR